MIQRPFENIRRPDFHRNVNGDDRSSHSRTDDNLPLGPRHDGARTFEGEGEGKKPDTKEKEGSGC